jgi:hypothetical protein
MSDMAWWRVVMLKASLFAEEQIGVTWEAK